MKQKPDQKANDVILLKKSTMVEAKAIEFKSKFKKNKNDTQVQPVHTAEHK